MFDTSYILLDQPKNIYIYIYIYKQAYAQWQAGATLAELVEEHDFAPTALLRLILQEDGCSRGQIKKGLREPSRYFPGRKDIAEAVKSASETDGFSWIECGFHRPAKEWEDAVVKHFQTRLGLDLVTEAELNVFQRHLFGRQVATPDLLLKTPVRINGQEVNWVDAKHVYFSSKCKHYARLSFFFFFFSLFFFFFFWGGGGWGLVRASCYIQPRTCAVVSTFLSNPMLTAALPASL